MTHEKLKEGEKVAALSAIVTIGLCGLKCFVGVASGSVALMADAVHSMADVVTVSAVFIGLKLSQIRSI